MQSKVLVQEKMNLDLQPSSSERLYLMQDDQNLYQIRRLPISRFSSSISFQRQSTGHLSSRPSLGNRSQISASDKAEGCIIRKKISRREVIARKSESGEDIAKKKIIIWRIPISDRSLASLEKAKKSMTSIYSTNGSVVETFTNSEAAKSNLDVQVKLFYKSTSSESVIELEEDGVVKATFVPYCPRQNMISVGTEVENSYCSNKSEDRIYSREYCQPTVAMVFSDHQNSKDRVCDLRRPNLNSNCRIVTEDEKKTVDSDNYDSRVYMKASNEFQYKHEENIQKKNEPKLLTNVSSLCGSTDLGTPGNLMKSQILLNEEEEEETKTNTGTNSQKYNHYVPGLVQRSYTALVMDSDKSSSMERKEEKVHASNVFHTKPKEYNKQYEKLNKRDLVSLITSLNSTIPNGWRLDIPEYSVVPSAPEYEDVIGSRNVSKEKLGEVPGGSTTEEEVRECRRSRTPARTTEVERTEVTDCQVNEPRQELSASLHDLNLEMTRDLEEKVQLKRNQLKESTESLMKSSVRLGQDQPASGYQQPMQEQCASLHNLNLERKLEVTRDLEENVQLKREHSEEVTETLRMVPSAGRSQDQQLTESLRDMDLEGKLKISRDLEEEVKLKTKHLEELTRMMAPSAQLSQDQPAPGRYQPRQKLIESLRDMDLERKLEMSRNLEEKVKLKTEHLEEEAENLRKASSVRLSQDQRGPGHYQPKEALAESLRDMDLERKLELMRDLEQKVQLKRQQLEVVRRSIRESLCQEREVNIKLEYVIKKIACLKKNGYEPHHFDLPSMSRLL